MTKIMIVEDESIVAESLSDQLELLGYEVTAIVASGEDALEKVIKPRPDLVLMDIMLKGEMDGIITADRIRHRWDIPVVYLTAYSDPQTLERAKITEPFGYIIKPFKERDLHTTIEIALYKYRTEKQIKESEQWLSTILRSIGDAVITLDTASRITYMSSIAEYLTQWKQEEAMGRDLLEVLPVTDKDAPDLMDGLISRARKGETVSCLVDRNAYLQTPDGKQVPVDAGASPIRSEGKVVRGIVLAIRDITERKMAEERLSEAQQMLSNLLTPREKEILQLMVDGSATKEIAYDLNISPRTVEVHRQNMMQKLNVHDIAMLVRCAITHKLVTVN